MQIKHLIALATVGSAAVLPQERDTQQFDTLLPTPIPTDNFDVALSFPEVITWTVDDIMAATHNQTSAPPSGNLPAEMASIAARQIIDNRYLETRTSYPFSATGRVLRTWPGASSWCSGSLVGNRVALMARHCLGDGISYRFQPAYYNGERFGSAGVTHVIYIPGTNEDNGGCGWKDDWALLILDRPLNTGYLGFGLFQDSMSNVHNNWWMYGYPQDKSGSGQLPYASNGFRIWKTTGCGSSEGGALNHNAGSFSGMSGGPVWFPHSDGPYQYGVHVGRAGTSYGLLSHGSAILNAIIRARNDFP